MDEAQRNLPQLRPGAQSRVPSSDAPEARSHFDNASSRVPVNYCSFIDDIDDLEGRSDSEADQRRNNVSTDLDSIFQNKRKTHAFSDEKAAKRVNTDTSDHLKNSSILPMITSYRKEKSQANLHQDRADSSNNTQGRLF